MKTQITNRSKIILVIWLLVVLIPFSGNGQDASAKWPLTLDYPTNALTTGHITTSDMVTGSGINSLYYTIIFVNVKTGKHAEINPDAYLQFEIGRAHV